MPIYTRLGDTGRTVTLSGKKVYKDDAKVEAYGQLDELNALLGVVIAFTKKDEDVKAILEKAQKNLFILGAELMIGKKGRRKIGAVDVEELESAIDTYEEQLTALANFIIPGGSKTASLLHLARSVCRRCERSIVALSRKETIDPVVVVYLNRLSDLLFVLARYVNRKRRVPEVIWKG